MLEPLRVASLLAAALIALPSLAAADPPPPPTASPTAAEEALPEVTVLQQNGQRIYQYNRTTIVNGEPQRPYSFAVSGRAPLGYSALEARVSFVPQVVDATRRDPF